jgi:hypothetical protein
MLLIGDWRPPLELMTPEVAEAKDMPPEEDTYTEGEAVDKMEAETSVFRDEGLA